MSEREEYAIKCTEHLKQVLKDNACSFALLGQLLKEAKSYFKDLPNNEYKTIYDFAEKELSLCRTTTKYYIAIHTSFCTGIRLKADYEEYNYSQLREMVSLTAEELKQVTPLMTADQIRKIKLKNKKIEDIAEENLISTYLTQSFKNVEERSEFLKNYSKWELFREIPELTLKFFRAKMSNGTYIIATESQVGKSLIYDDYYFDKPYIHVYYSVIDKNNINSRYDITGAGGVTGVIKYITNNKLSYIKEN